ncbi:hypothetical protein EFO40_00980 [Lactococcus cremoris]|uniref:hypothetical protein n=1 Tax=Lactococcus TaxID=1357 RepID=UPI000200CE54|nr:MULTISPECIES: hypothetical protein [Lactococcus]ADZ64987.1 hypothetical protein CVCAS_pA0018 [Lactococcus lactis subsp. lactis CV56]MCT0026868.1 hypothetical protein [Lactococcus lactis subsp. lactis]MCT3105683.1 hypothetical protein [Lactococcus lactis]MCT4462156.1 hypothetical protein [Lactococcus cremoris]MDT2890557.1 hypothetical protein [Lactococcus lactis]
MALALEKERLFFQIYQSLEKELLGMTDYIHFSENNLDVYSVKLANFILRANVESESLLKELFKRTEHYKGLTQKEKNLELENNTYTEVNEVYKLEKKTIYIASEIFYFQDKYSEPFIPFKYKKNGKDSHKIYNSIKHDKVNNLKKADLETAINMLGTLFILNSCFFPELIQKEQDDRSKIFRGKRAYIEPLFLSMFDKIDKLNKDEVENYLSSCLYFEWISDYYLTENLPYHISDISGMLENHLNDVNLPLDTLIEKRNKNEYLYDDLNYPVLFKYSTVITNTGEDINYFRKKSEQIFKALLEKQEE